MAEEKRKGTTPCNDGEFDSVLADIHESRTFAQTRDLLLPKLMSGEIRVKDAERTIEAVL